MRLLNVITSKYCTSSYVKTYLDTLKSWYLKWSLIVDLWNQCLIFKWQVVHLSIRNDHSLMGIREGQLFEESIIIPASYQWLFLVPLIGGRWHIIPQLAVYTTYIPPIRGNQKQPLIIHPMKLKFGIKKFMLNKIRNHTTKTINICTWQRWSLQDDQYERYSNSQYIPKITCMAYVLAVYMCRAYSGYEVIKCIVLCTGVFSWNQCVMIRVHDLSTYPHKQGLI